MVAEPNSLQQITTTFDALSRNTRDIPIEGQEILVDVIHLIASGLSDVSDFLPEKDKLSFGTRLSLATLSILNVSHYKNKRSSKSAEVAWQKSSG